MTDQEPSPSSPQPATDAPGADKVQLVRATQSTLAFFVVLVLTIPASLLAAIPMLPEAQRIWGVCILAGFIFLLIALTSLFAVRYPVVFLGYNHPLIARRRMHGPPTPGLYVYTKPPAQKKIDRGHGVVIWSNQMNHYTGRLAMITRVNTVTMTASLDIDGGVNVWAWEWLDFIEMPQS